jgi:hypothetical protein
VDFGRISRCDRRIVRRAVEKRIARGFGDFRARDRAVGCEEHADVDGALFVVDAHVFRICGLHEMDDVRGHVGLRAQRVRRACWCSGRRRRLRDLHGEHERVQHQLPVP